MWHRKNKVWMHYLNDIIAADVSSAVFLAAYLRQLIWNCQEARYLEIVDLQQYRVLRQPTKVRAAIKRQRLQEPFVFAVGKN